MAYDQNLADCERSLNEANKLLEQTIEVLEGFLGDGPAQMWWRDQAKPLLDNLKAREKEGTE